MINNPIGRLVLMKTVSVVIVTYNRSECLRKLLSCLEDQTYQIHNLFIFDNYSDDDTQKMLFDLGIVRTPDAPCKCINRIMKGNVAYYYYRNDRNIGGSGGFNSALSMAKEIECDYIWIMDDDVAPERECLERLVGGVSEKGKVCIPNRTDSFFVDQACIDIDLKSLYKFKISFRKRFAPHPLVKKYYSVRDMTFEGSLIDISVIKEIGLPNKDYFIEFDDTDYAFRILQITSITFVTEAVLHRQLQAKNNNCNKWRYNWRNYYSIRNNILFNHRYCITWRARHLSTGLLWLYHIVRSIYHGEFRNNVHIINCAVRDGMKDRYGMVVSPGEVFAWSKRGR